MTIKFENPWSAAVKTESGKDAIVYKNEFNIGRQLYQLVVEGKTVFARGSMDTVIRYLKTH